MVHGGKVNPEMILRKPGNDDDRSFIGGISDNNSGNTNANAKSIPRNKSSYNIEGEFPKASNGSRQHSTDGSTQIAVQGNIRA
ncbi:hypothetical protein ACN4EG_26590, partial [Alkalinema pantanalense CENA528]|uniref:hypothetical protein n=1 Tax=Alkalinema pantanalense TaxID=1620705 RepID=UPI003D6F6295